MQPLMFPSSNVLFQCKAELLASPQSPHRVSGISLPWSTLQRGLIVWMCGFCSVFTALLGGVCVSTRIFCKETKSNAWFGLCLLGAEFKWDSRLIHEIQSSQRWPVRNDPAAAQACSRGGVIAHNIQKDWEGRSNADEQGPFSSLLSSSTLCPEPQQLCQLNVLFYALIGKLRFIIKPFDPNKHGAN